MEVTGALVGMTTGGHHFYRQCILVSAASGQEADETKRDKMIEQTGVFAPPRASIPDATAAALTAPGTMVF
jgi:hypothetical protein